MVPPKPSAKRDDERYGEGKEERDKETRRETNKDLPSALSEGKPILNRLRGLRATFTVIP